MASFNDYDKIRKRLRRSNNQDRTEPQILGYNPNVLFEASTSSPWTLTITEITDKVILKTIIEYDKKYPKGNVTRIRPQEVVQLDSLPDEK